MVSMPIPPYVVIVCVELQYWNALTHFVTESARLSRELDNRRLKEDSHRYGQVLVERSGTLLTEVWDDGELMKSILRRQVGTLIPIRHLKIRNVHLTREHLTIAYFSISFFSQSELAEMKEDLEKKRRALRKRPSSVNEAVEMQLKKGISITLNSPKSF